MACHFRIAVLVSFQKLLCTYMIGSQKITLVSYMSVISGLGWVLVSFQNMLCIYMIGSQKITLAEVEFVHAVRPSRQHCAEVALVHDRVLDMDFAYLS